MERRLEIALGDKMITWPQLFDMHDLGFTTSPGQFPKMCECERTTSD